MRISEVHLTNFQCYEEVSLELDSGFNVLIGDSNVGKTAILRALRLLFFNVPKGTSMVREGASSLSVSVTIEGCVIQRIKGPKTNIYKVGDQSFHSFGSEIPPEVVKATKLSPIDLGDTSLVVHFASQLEPPFLLGLPDSQKGKLLLSLSKARDIDDIFREVRQELSSVSKRVDYISQEIEKLNENLVQYSWLPDAELALEKITQWMEEIQQLEKRVEYLDQLRLRYSRITTALNSDQESYTAISSILEEVSALSLEESGSRLGILSSLQKQWNTLDAQERFLHKQLESMADLPQITHLQEEALSFCERLETLEGLHQEVFQLEKISQNTTLEFLGVKRLLEKEEVKQKQLMETIGNTCPVCRRPLNDAVVHLKEWVGSTSDQGS